MSLMKNKIVEFKNRLTRINDSEPLSKLSLVVIIALDIFMLTVVFNGLAEHTKQLTSPAEYVPYDCRSVLISQQWTNADKISKLQRLVLTDYNYYLHKNKKFEPSKIAKMHPVCKDFYQKTKVIAEDKKLKTLFVSRQSLLSERSRLNRSFRSSKGVYDTALLRDIAKKSQDSDKLAMVSDTIKEQSQRIEDLTKQVVGIENQINNNPSVKALWRMVLFPGSKHRNQLVKDLKGFELRYYLKELGWQLLFLLPLFAIFYAWNSRSVKKDNKIQILISSHLLVIVFIPILFKIIEVVLDLIPEQFFRALFILLKSLHLIAIWHYILILLSVGAALFCIYIIQKKIFNKHRLELKRLMNGECYSCGKKLPNAVKICPFCGSKQYKSCPSCSQDTYAGGEYCINCANKQK